jgi:predicted nucleotidyltransferase
MKNATINIEVIKTIATALAEMNNQVVFVGGATVGLYINDPAAHDVRPTKDVDISLSLATLVELEQIREELIQKGFIQDSQDTIICRFRYNDIKVDVMNTKAIGWAPANPWFQPGFLHKETLQIEDQIIHILPLPYFLATKFTAFNDRGNGEPRTSHDFEDIVYVLDNRTNIEAVILSAPQDVKHFLKEAFEQILFDKVKQEAILGNLYYETRDERFGKVIKKLKNIVTSI